MRTAPPRTRLAAAAALLTTIVTTAILAIGIAGLVAIVALTTGVAIRAAVERRQE